MTKIQELINGKPGRFAKRFGCPKSTANHYSDGTRKPPEWIAELIEWAFANGYNYEVKYEEKTQMQ